MRGLAGGFSVCAVACVALSVPVPVLAQERVQETAEITASGEAYLKSLRFRGIETDVAYFDPTRPAPELDTKQTPDPTSDDIDVNLNRQQGNFIVNVVSLAILLGMAYLFLRYGGTFSVSLRADSDASRSLPGGQGADGKLAAIPEDLTAIARIEDRKEALVTLAQSALIRAVRKHGLLLQRSWTARDAFRRLPKDMLHHSALRELVTAGERVLFGGRDVTEADFQGHLTQIRPLFTDVDR